MASVDNERLKELLKVNRMVYPTHREGSLEDDKLYIYSDNSWAYLKD